MQNKLKKYTIIKFKKQTKKNLYFKKINKNKNGVFAKDTFIIMSLKLKYIKLARE